MMRWMKRSRTRILLRMWLEKQGWSRHWIKHFRVKKVKSNFMLTVWERSLSPSRGKRQKQEMMSIFLLMPICKRQLMISWKKSLPESSFPIWLRLWPMTVHRQKREVMWRYRLVMFTMHLFPMRFWMWDILRLRMPGRLRKVCMRHFPPKRRQCLQMWWHSWVIQVRRHIKTVMRICRHISVILSVLYLPRMQQSFRKIRLIPMILHILRGKMMRASVSILIWIMRSPRTGSIHQNWLIIWTVTVSIRIRMKYIRGFWRISVQIFLRIPDLTNWSTSIWYAMKKSQEARLVWCFMSREF